MEWFDLFEASTDAFLVLSSDGRCVNVNEACCALLLKSKGDLVGQDVFADRDGEGEGEGGGDGDKKTFAWEFRTLSGRKTACIDHEGYTVLLVVPESSKETAEAIKHLHAITLAAQKVVALSSFTETARSIFNIAKNLTGASAGYVALLAPNGDENDVLFLDPGPNICEVDPTLRMPIRGLRGEAYRSGHAVMDNNFGSSPHWKFMPPGHVILHNVCFGPLVIDGLARGLIGLSNKATDFTESDLSAVELLSGLCAVALKNSRILDRLNESEAKFRGLAEQLPGIAYSGTLTTRSAATATEEETSPHHHPHPHPHPHAQPHSHPHTHTHTHPHVTATASHTHAHAYLSKEDQRKGVKGPEYIHSGGPGSGGPPSAHLDGRSHTDGSAIGGNSAGHGAADRVMNAEAETDGEAPSFSRTSTSASDPSSFEVDVDLDLDLALISGACEDLTGYTPDELMRPSALLRLVPDDYDKRAADLGMYVDLVAGGELSQKGMGDKRRVQTVWEKAASAGGAKLSFVHRVVHRNGAIRWVRESVLSTSIGGVVTLYGLMTDITEIVVAQERQKIAVRHLHEVRRTQAISMLAGGVAHEFNNVLTGAVGLTSIVSSQLSSQLEAAGGTGTGSGTDDQADSESSVIASSLSHLRDLDSSLARASELSSKLLALSGMGSFIKGFHNISDLVERYVVAFQEKIKSGKVDAAAGDSAGSGQRAADIDIVFEAAADSKRLVAEIDSYQISFIVQELLSNAVDAIKEKDMMTEKRSGKESADSGVKHRITVSMRRGRSDITEAGGGVVPVAGDKPVMCAVLAVSDNGLGFNEDQQHRMTDPFYTTKSGARGLGLAAVAGYVKGHSGMLALSSVPGCTKIQCFFPLAADQNRRTLVASPQSIQMPSPAYSGPGFVLRGRLSGGIRDHGHVLPPSSPTLPATESGRGRESPSTATTEATAVTPTQTPTPARSSVTPPPLPLRILVVDDEMVVRKVSQRILTKEGYNVTLAVDGIDGVNRYRELSSELACVILDLSMPRLDGYGAFEQMTAFDPTVPVIISSGCDQSECMTRMGELSTSSAIAGFLPKPYHPSNLISMVKNITTQHQRQRGGAGLTESNSGLSSSSSHD